MIEYTGWSLEARRPMAANGLAMFDKRVVALAHQSERWPEAKIAQRNTDVAELIRERITAGNTSKLSTALHAASLTSEIAAQDAIYRANDPVAAKRALSRACYAKYLSDWTKYVLIPDPTAMKGGLDNTCDQAMLSLWLGFKPGLRLSCIMATALADRHRLTPGSLDSTHLNFCLRVCNAQQLVPPIALFSDAEGEDIYASLLMPASGQEKTAMSSINAALERRIAKAYQSNVNENFSTGGHFYGGAFYCVMPNELLAYLRWCESQGVLDLDVSPDPWLSYFGQIQYDDVVEEESVFLETKDFVESRRLR